MKFDVNVMGYDSELGVDIREMRGGDQVDINTDIGSITLRMDSRLGLVAHLTLPGVSTYFDQWFPVFLRREDK